MKYIIVLCFIATVGCKLKPDEAAANQPTPTIDDQLSGFWQLTGTNSSLKGIRAPKILKLQINSNNTRQADYCGLAQVGSQGMSSYSISGNDLEIESYTFADPANPQPNELPMNKFTFGGKITKLEADTFEIENTLTYVRFVPPTKSLLTDNAGDLCK